MSVTLEQLQAQVEALTKALQVQGVTPPTLPTGRSPILGPLTNLLHPPPSATVAKPNFFYDGMNLPSNPGTPFPALRFRLTETGVEEKLLRTQAELDALGPEWSTSPPTLDLPSPLESLEEAMASLTDEEKVQVMEEQRNVRLSAIKAQLAALSPEDLAAVATGQPKKKPGRPKKES